MIILVDASIKNLWSIEAIQCVFQLASSLQINFSKSTLIRVNFDPAILDLTCDFLHCQLESLMFKYLGILVGGQPPLVLYMGTSS